MNTFKFIRCSKNNVGCSKKCCSTTFMYIFFVFQGKDPHLRHSHFGEHSGLGGGGLGDAYSTSMQEENLDRIETVICDSEQLSMGQSSRTGTKAKNLRGSVVSEGSSVGLLKGAAFGIHQEFMQFKNSLLEGKASLDNKQKRKR